MLHTFADPSERAV